MRRVGGVGKENKNNHNNHEGGGGLLASLTRARLVIIVILIFVVLGPGHNFLLMLQESAADGTVDTQTVMHYLESTSSSFSIGKGIYESERGREIRVAPDDALVHQIPTKLWLDRDIKVSMLKMEDWWHTQEPESGLALYFLDGIREHPHVHLTESWDEADCIVHFVTHTNFSAYPDLSDPSHKIYDKLVVIDENDYFENSFHQVFRDHELLAFFKRSFIKKTEGEPSDIDRRTGKRDLTYSHWPMAHNYLPFTYGVARRYTAGFYNEQDLMDFDQGEKRDIPVVCTLREYHKPAWPGGRENAVSWLNEMNITGAIVGEVSDWREGNRGADSKPYIDAMKRAKIVVTANPGNWEGDFRFWEALASKALIISDYFYMPVPDFFEDGVDVVFFDPLNKQEFIDKVNYYLDHPEEARRIAMNGYYKALKYHRYVNRVDYVFNTVAQLLDGSYQHCGWAMKEWAMRSEHHIHDSQHGLRKWPGKPLSQQEKERQALEAPGK